MDRIAFVRNLLVAAASIGLALALSATARADVGVTINGNAVTVAPPAILQGAHVFVPLRSVFENLGATVAYSNGQITATTSNTAISLTIGSTQATVNGSPVAIDVAPFIIGDSTYVPLRFVSEALGASVSWDDSAQMVNIVYNGATTNPQPENPPAQVVAQAPPPIPAYEPPPVPEPNYVWMPGYWAWGYGGYYWVPGTWVQAPQAGLLWTPGYWSWQLGNFGWHPGYWAEQVGYYGGINYGGGYYGNNFVGGNWSQNGFRYNTAVFPVTNTTTITNVYVNKTVVINNTAGNRISYNGGPHGITAQPNARELSVAQMPHVAMTTVQRQHEAVAGSDRRALQTVNAGQPAVLAAPHAYTPVAKPSGFVPVTVHDRVPTPARPTPPPTRPTAAPVYHAPPSPLYHAPVVAHPAATAAPTPRVIQAPTVATPMPRPPTPRPTLRPTPTPTPTPRPRARPRPTPTPTPTPLSRP